MASSFNKQRSHAVGDNFVDVSYIEDEAGKKLSKQELVNIMTEALLYMQKNNTISIVDAIDKAVGSIYNS